MKRYAEKVDVGLNELRKLVAENLAIFPPASRTKGGEVNQRGNKEPLDNSDLLATFQVF